MLREGGASRIEVSYEGDDERVIRSQIEHPLVVFEQRIGFDDNRAGDAQALRSGGEIGGQSAPIKQRIVLGRPRNALRTGGIVKMDVGIDDAAGRGRFRSGQREEACTEESP